MEDNTPTPESIEIQRLQEINFLNKKAKIQQDKLLAKYSRLLRAKGLGILTLEYSEEILEEIEDGIEELEAEETSPETETNLSEARTLIRNNRIKQAVENLLKEKNFPTKSKRNLEKVFTKYERLKRSSLMGTTSQKEAEKMMDEIVETILENHL